MEAVVFIQHMEDALTRLSREAEQVHGGIFHAEQRRQGFRFLRLEKIGMIRLAVAIATSKEVEIAVGRIEIGIDADEATEVHQESKMKICH